MSRRFAPSLILCALLAPSASAHPVPLENHDRTTVVRLEHKAGSDRVIVTVAYRLELDERTALDDLKEAAEDVDFSKFDRRKLDTFFAEFTRVYAPILARKLHAALDGKPLTFACVKHGYRLEDEQGQKLGHLRCDFAFEASAPVSSATEHEFTFRDGTYATQNGLIDVSLADGAGARIVRSVAPSVELKKRAKQELRPGDDDRLREITATFKLTTAAAPTAPTETPATARTPRDPAHDEGLWDLFFHSDHALWLLLVLAAAFGAVHALTPGHGKTLVAAYLVGERGTSWHAVVLGLVTTLTHTAVVIVVALVLAILYPNGVPADARQSVQTTLQLTMGLLVASLGVWLLLRRVSGRADHIHLGGHGHHHHHGHGHHHHHHDHSHADHDHDAEGRVVPRQGPVGWWGLIVMGVTGGIVPCWDAIFILLLTVGTNELWLALPLVLAFSAGLASVLVLIGILVVHARGFAASRWGEGRLVRSLPIVSAVAVTVLGLWLCYQAIHGRPPPQPTASVVDSRP
jgi:ABC-type nickel/cobalt efflux system permease component RcnA